MPHKSEKNYRVDAAQADERLDIFLGRQPEIASRTRARRLISLGSVFVNKRRCKIASRKLHTRAVVSAHLAPLSWSTAFLERQESLMKQVRVVGELDGALVVFKPAGLQTQGTPQGDKYTLMRAVGELVECSPADLYLVHRLDQVTSGLLVLAQNKGKAAELTALLKKREMRRRYLAVVEGAMHGDGVIDMAVGENCRRPARTRYKVLATGYLSLVQLELETGRTHQIRVHLASKGHPIVGDRRYGASREMGEQEIALTAFSLSIGKETWKIDVDVPSFPWSEFQELKN